MTKTIVFKYNPYKRLVDSDGDNMTFIYGVIDILKELGYPTPKNIKVLKHGPHRDSFIKGFEKAVIKCSFS